MLIKKNYQDIRQNPLLLRTQLKISAIFPHPDDETVCSGGFLTYLSQCENFDVEAISVTKGEKGNELIDLPEDELGALRAQEFEKALAVLGVKNSQIWNFPDGGLKDHETDLKERLKTYLETTQPDLVITYEKSGIYGHPDHVYLSKWLTEIAEEMGDKRKFTLLYVTFPYEIACKMHLPTFMAEQNYGRQAEPEYHFRLGRLLLTKYKAALKYRSQNVNRGYRLINWPLYLGQEYFTTKYNSGDDSKIPDKIQ